MSPAPPSAALETCEICHVNEAVFTCRLCKRRVCREHYDEARGLCVVCSSSLCEICGARLAVTFCPICGRLVCYEDSVQVDNVRRVCRKCFEAGLRWPTGSREAEAFISGAVRLARRVVSVDGVRG